MESKHDRCQPTERNLAFVGNERFDGSSGHIDVAGSSK